MLCEPEFIRQAAKLGLRARIMPGWGELQLRSEGNDPKLICQIERAGEPDTAAPGERHGPGGAMAAGCDCGLCSPRTP
jgi:hypothetical protein